jgi:hypothetical protein
VHKHGLGVRVGEGAARTRSKDTQLTRTGDAHEGRRGGRVASAAATVDLPAPGSPHSTSTHVCARSVCISASEGLAGGCRPRPVWFINRAGAP